MASDRTHEQERERLLECLARAVLRMPFNSRKPWLEKWGRLHGAASRKDLEARITAEYARLRTEKVTQEALA